MIHGPHAEVGWLADLATSWMKARIGHAPLGRTAAPADVSALLAGSITDAGVGLDLSLIHISEPTRPY